MNEKYAPAEVETAAHAHWAQPLWDGHEAYRVTERLKKAEADVIAHVDFGDEPKVDAAKPDEPADLRMSDAMAAPLLSCAPP